MTVTFDAAVVGYGITLSNGNLTAQEFAGGVGVCTSSGSQRAAGTANHYWEFHVDAFASTDHTAVACGLSTYQNPMSNGPGYNYEATPIDWGWSADGSIWISQAQTTGVGPTWTAGDTLQFLLKAGALYVGVNGTMQATPIFTGLTATIGPAFGAETNATGTNQVTANFGASAFTYAMPTGATSWDGSQTGGVSGSPALTDPADTLTASGTVGSGVTGSPALTDPADSVSASTSMSNRGTAALTDPADTVSVSSSLRITGSTALSDPADGIAAAASLSFTGSASLADPSDAISAASTFSVVSSPALTDPSDTLASSSTFSITGSPALADPDDVLVASGSLGVTGSPALTDPQDAVATSAALEIAGASTLTEPDDTISASGSISINGSSVLVDPDDAMAMVADLSINGSSALVEPSDTINAYGYMAGERLPLVLSPDGLIEQLQPGDTIPFLPYRSTGNPSAVTPAASPWTYQNSGQFAVFMCVLGSSGQSVSVSKDGVTYLPVGTQDASFLLPAGWYMRVTYTTAPANVTLIPMA